MRFAQHSLVIMPVDATEVAAELARLEPRVARPLALLAQGIETRDVAAQLGCSYGHVWLMRRYATQALGPDSPLIRALPPRKYRKSTTFEPQMVSLYTTPGPDGHVHVATFDANGRGSTDAVNNHSHRIWMLDVQPANDHHHELTEQRA